MATHLRRADDELRAAISALDSAVVALPASAISLLGPVLDAVRDARDHLSRIDAGDVATHLSVEMCQAWRDRSRTGRCGAPADVILEDEGYCAAHTCATCSKEPVALGGTDCGRCDEKWQAQQDAADAHEAGHVDA
jgi:hypothetical protein